MAVPDFMNYSHASADDASKTLARMIKYCGNYNWAVSRFPSLKIPDNVLGNLKRAQGLSGQAAKYTGYAVDIRKINDLLNQLDRLPKPYPPGAAIGIFSQLMLISATYIRWIPNSSYLADGVEAFGKGLPALVNNITAGGNNPYPELAEEYRKWRSWP